MLITPLKVIRLPSVTTTPLPRIYEDSTQQAEELAAWLRGEDACSGLLAGIPNSTKRLITKDLQPPIDEQMIVKCNDGEISYNKSRLRRRFQLIDDFFNDFPSEGTIEVPFTQDEVTKMTSCYFSLAECYEYLSFFNPKDILTYFEYDTIGADPSLLVDLVRKMTNENRKTLLEARRMNGRTYPLPDEGMGIGILGYILDVHQDMKSLVHFFSNYPSFLTFATPNMNHRVDLLLNADYKSSEEYWTSSQDTVERIFGHINLAMFSIAAGNLPSEQKGKIQRLLAMLGIRHKLFKNEGMEIALPYNLPNDWFLNKINTPEAIEQMVAGGISVNPTANPEELKRVFEELITNGLEKVLDHMIV